MQTPNTLVSSPDKPRLKPRNLFHMFVQMEEQERIFNNLARIGSSATDDADSTEWGYIPPSDSRMVVEEVDAADLERLKVSLSAESAKSRYAFAYENATNGSFKSHMGQKVIVPPRGLSWTDFGLTESITQI